MSKSINNFKKFILNAKYKIKKKLFKEIIYIL